MKDLGELQKEAALEKRRAYLEKYGFVNDVSEEFAKMELTPFLQKKRR